MKQILNQLFIEKIKINEDILDDSLFISLSDISALRHDYIKVVNELKQHNKIEIIKENSSNLAEGYKQGLFIIKADDSLYFVRLITVNDALYDCLVYKNYDEDLIDRVFFSTKKIIIPLKLQKMLDDNEIVAIGNLKDEKYRIVKANNTLYRLIGYEDWDFENKYENLFNGIFVSKEKYDFSDLEVYKSDGSIVNLSFQILEIDGFFCLKLN